VLRESANGEFEITTRVSDGICVLGMRGELDMDTAPTVQAALAATDSGLPLVIDLTECGFIDSQGLAAILHGIELRKKGELAPVIACPPGHIRELLRMTAIDQSFPVFKSADDAAEAVSPAG
jgi:anti-sigma B factor antagonist